jgi:phosphocarrier protein HPr
VLRQPVTICNRLGLHARAAARFVQLASRFESDIKIIKGEKEVNGKSIMGVMMLAAGVGAALELVASGGDEADALAQLQQLIDNRFGEDE